MLTLFAFFALGPTEMVISLVIILILFGALRLPHLMSGMQEGIHNFKHGIQEDELWQFTDGRQRQLHQSPKPGRHKRGFTFIGSAVLLLIMAATVEGVISATQALIMLGVLVAMALTWWFCFGKKEGLNPASGHSSCALCQPTYH